MVDGVLRLDTRTGQGSKCSRSNAGWACKVVPDERSALETEIARLQGENASLKKELLARGLPVPSVPSPSGARPDEPELKLPSDADVDKVISFLEKVWRRLIVMGRTMQKDVERGSPDHHGRPPSSRHFTTLPIDTGKARASHVSFALSRDKMVAVIA